MSFEELPLRIFKVANNALILLIQVNFHVSLEDSMIGRFVVA